MLCNPHWSLVVQCVEHLRMCHAKSPTNTKAAIVLRECRQFKYVTTCLKLLEHIRIDTPVFTKLSPLGNIHTLVKVPWRIHYWVIDKDTPIKMSSTPVQSLIFSTSIHKSDIASHWLPAAVALTIIDPHEPEPLM